MWTKGFENKLILNFEFVSVFRLYVSISGVAWYFSQVLQNIKKNFLVASALVSGAQVVSTRFSLLKLTLIELPLLGLGVRVRVRVRVRVGVRVGVGMLQRNTLSIFPQSCVAWASRRRARASTGERGEPGCCRRQQTGSPSELRIRNSHDSVRFGV